MAEYLPMRAVPGQPLDRQDSGWQAGAMDSQPSATGLRKRCPRCGREGQVLLRGRWFEIVWAGRGRNPSGARKDVDMGVSLSVLLSPEFGCGYDPKQSAPTD